MSHDRRLKAYLIRHLALLLLCVISSACASDSESNKPLADGDIESETDIETIESNETEQTDVAPFIPPEAFAIIEEDRSGHFFNRPYPSDELLTAKGTVGLEHYPSAGMEIGDNFVQGWVRQVAAEVFGFSSLTLIAFRFDRNPEAAARYEGTPTDMIRLYSLDSGDRIPIVTRFIEDDLGDPFLVPNLLLIMPDPTTPLLSGERYIAELDKRFANAPEGYEKPEKASEEASVATIFTVADNLGQYRALRETTDARIDAQPEMLTPDEDGFREIASISYKQGETPNGKKATICTVTFTDGGEEITYLDNKDGVADSHYDLTDGDFIVYQTKIQTLSFQPKQGRPYISAGVGFINDYNRTDGWIAFDSENNVLSNPYPEPFRIVVQVPKPSIAEAPYAAITWAHGSGGHAFEPVARINPEDELQALRETIAKAGAVIVSADLPLYGQRHPMIEEGYSKDLGFYNVGNLIAYRDNLRQGAIDQRVLYRFVTESLPSLLPEGTIDLSRIGAFGHSLGNQTTMLGFALQENLGQKAGMFSGTGGFISNYIAKGNVVSGSDVSDMIFMLAGVEAPENPSGGAVIGALMGVPEEGWERVDKMHPVLNLFQMIIDPSDPLSMARTIETKAVIAMGVGDRQAPNEGAKWLAEALPNGILQPCQPNADYDGHYCLFRETTGQEFFRQFIDEL